MELNAKEVFFSTCFCFAHVRPNQQTNKIFYRATTSGNSVNICQA